MLSLDASFGGERPHNFKMCMDWQTENYAENMIQSEVIDVLRIKRSYTEVSNLTSPRTAFLQSVQGLLCAYSRTRLTPLRSSYCVPSGFSSQPLYVLFKSNFHFQAVSGFIEIILSLA